jgi:hypothetical protein
VSSTFPINGWAESVTGHPGPRPGTRFRTIAAKGSSAVTVAEQSVARVRDTTVEEGVVRQQPLLDQIFSSDDTPPGSRRVRRAPSARVARPVSRR